MAKTLVIAEKPSVGQDLARVLPGPFQKHMGAGERTTRWLEGPEHLVTWAVGHLVQLAEPDEYDDKYKKWRMADLPIVPRHFKLVVRDERSQKQMAVVRDLLRRDDVDRILNACDAGREGELIFKWVLEKASAGNGGVKNKPIERLWLSSMTKQAMRDALAHTRPDEEMKQLEEAAKSRSEADWLVGMNATRAATIRLRSSFDGAVSLGRVQTPTLAILTRREEEIRAFKPEKYWLVDARFATDDDRRYAGRFHEGTQPRLKSAADAEAIVAAVKGRRGEITKLDKAKRTERPPLLFDLTSLQREANTRYGFSARRTLAAAQRCYEEHKVLTYPRTSSRYLTSDMVPEIKPTAAKVGRDGPEYAAGAKYVTGLDLLPLGRVVDDAKVGDHHAIIPTNSDHDVSKLNQDDRRVFDLVARRFLAVFHPDAVFENTRVETTVEGHVFRTRGRVLLVPGWRGVYGELSIGERSAADEDEGDDQQLPVLERGEPATAREADALEKETKPPRRYTDASLLGAMETAGKLVDDDELREAMKDSGIGTPATRAAIIERLIDVGYVEREARALVATEKGLNVIRLLGRPRAHVARPDRRLGAPARPHRARRGAPRAVHGRHREVRGRDRRDARRDAQGRPHPAGQPRAVPGVRPRHRREPQGLLVLVARGPGLRLRHLEVEGGQAAAARRGARADRDGADREGRSPASRAAAGGRSAPASPSSRATTASGGSSSTSRGRARARSRPRRSPRAPPRAAAPTRTRRPPRRSASRSLYRSGVAARGADDVRQRDRAGLEVEPPDPLDRPAAGGDRRLGVARAVAAAGQPWPDAPVVEPALHRPAAAGGDHVLVEAQLPVGSDDAPQLGQRGRLIGDAAQHERGDRGVERCGLGREGVGEAGDHGHVDRRGARRLLRPLAQVGLGLDGDDLGDGRRVVAEVQAVARSDLDHAAGEAGEHLGPVLRAALALDAGAGRGVEAGEDRVARAVGHGAILADAVSRCGRPTGSRRRRARPRGRGSSRRRRAPRR